MDDISPGDSPEQRAAELVMLAALSAELGVPIEGRRFRVPDGTWTAVDGVADDPPLLVEAWAHQGAPKSAQKHKVMADALKMLWVEAAFFPGGARKVLLLADSKAAAHFGGRSWMAAALRHFKIEVRLIALPPGHLAAVAAAQVRQFR
jgi:hypothetical protein